MSKNEILNLNSLKIETANVIVKGTTDLIVHRRDFIDRTTKLGEKTPEQEFLDSKYFTEDGKDGIKSISFKLAMVRASTLFSKKIINMKMAKMLIQLDSPEIIPIKYSECYMRDDMVTINGTVPQHRYRAAYKDWSCKFSIKYPTNNIESKLIADLIYQSGILIGVGDYRAELGGLFGKFEISEYNIIK